MEAPAVSSQEGETGSGVRIRWTCFRSRARAVLATPEAERGGGSGG
jgi:hypothetical protein